MFTFLDKNNQQVFMTRRYPNLPKKVLRRDSEIVEKFCAIADRGEGADAMLDFFLKESKHLSDERYWEILRTLWIFSGSNENADIFRKLMRSPRKQKHYFSTPEDAKTLRELLEPVVVFRACNENDNGISWTTSKAYATNYQQAYFKSKIIEKTVSKKDIFAYVGRNREYEVIIL